MTVAVVDGWQTVRIRAWAGKRSPRPLQFHGKALLAETVLATLSAGIRATARQASTRLGTP